MRMTRKPIEHSTGKDRGRGMHAVSIMLCLLFFAGCATPIGTREVGVRRSYERIHLSSVNADEYSDASAQVLHRFFLEEQFEKDPDQVIATLHDQACEDERRDLLYALAELSYLSGNKSRKQPLEPASIEQAKRYYLASAVYAYLYLLGARGGELPNPYDRRFRVACDLYNASLAQVLSLREKESKLQEGPRQLPVGSIFLERRVAGFTNPLDDFDAIIPADALSIYGLTVHDRHPGLGTPFIAVAKRTPGIPVTRSVPGALFLRVEGDVRDLRRGGRGLMEIYSAYETRSVAVGGNRVPLEFDFSAQLAYSLNQPLLWQAGRMQFLRGEVLPSGIYPVQPYSPGRIPVVFVHGTFSSPVWWAEMFNTLRADAHLWERYQFWCYIYDSSKPIVLSAHHLRESLSKMVETLDPDGNDAALRQMVVAGHSQGGLLTKLTATETGDALVRATTGKALAELELKPDERELVDRYLIYKPLAFVRRVVFISTPHRGSYLAGRWARRLTKSIILLPVDMAKTTTNLFSKAEKIGIKGGPETGAMGTSLDSMSPQNVGLLALAEIPPAPGIQGHSIIAIDGDDMPPDGADGVVEYRSAHVDYVESEFIVRSGHSCQGHPLVIEEVRRILLAHLEGLNAH
jgi:pimeloyl-ACP methyl ester carboxylesterase